MNKLSGHDRAAKVLSAIPDQSRAGLVEMWVQDHGRQPPKGISRRLLEYSAGYQAQVKAFGGLKPAVKHKLQRLGTSKTEPTLATLAPRVQNALPPGTRLVREWHGHVHTVDVVDDGYLYDRKIYKSISKIARVITGARWSGPRFFGL
jgi:hypothetical protein